MAVTVEEVKRIQEQRRTSKRKAGYLRTSTDDQTLDQQLAAILGSVPEGTDLVWYEDQLSGWKGARPEYERLKADIRRGRIDTVWVFSVSRLGRNQQEALYFVKLCHENEVKLKVVSENLDFSGPIGVALFALFSALAQMDSDTKSLAIRAKFKFMRQEQGFKMHGNVRDVFSAKTVERSAEIIKMHQSGQSNKYIMRMLGVDERAVARVLRFHKEGKPIITRAQFAAQNPGWNKAINRRPQ